MILECLEMFLTVFIGLLVFAAWMALLMVPTVAIIVWGIEENKYLSKVWAGLLALVWVSVVVTITLCLLMAFV